MSSVRNGLQLQQVANGSYLRVYPGRVLRIAGEIEEWSSQNCSDGICQTYKTLSWIEDDSCNLTITCPVLKPQGCATAGVGISSKQDYKLCFEGQLLSTTIQPSGNLTIDMWASTGQKFNFSCYARCGDLSKINAETADALPEQSTPGSGNGTVSNSNSKVCHRPHIYCIHIVRRKLYL